MVLGGRGPLALEDALGKEVSLREILERTHKALIALIEAQDKANEISEAVLIAVQEITSR